MTLLGDFVPDDQRLILQGLEAAAVLVSTASLGRKEETASEGYAMAAYVLDSASDHIAHPLLMSIIQALSDRSAVGGTFPDYLKVVTAPGARDRAEAIVKSAVGVVEAGATPDEALGLQGLAPGDRDGRGAGRQGGPGVPRPWRGHGQRRGAGRAAGAGGSARP